MSRFPIILPCLLALSLSACLSLTPSEPSEPIPPLKLAKTPPLPIAGDIFAFSEDGTTFVAGWSYSGVALYRSSDYSLLEAYYQRDLTRSSPENPDGVSTGSVFAAGYADANTWYFAAHVDNSANPSGDDNFITHVHFRSITPSREIAKYSFNTRGRNDSAIAVNKDHFTFDGVNIGFESGLGFSYAPMVNWRTGEQHKAKVTLGYPAPDRHELTRSNRILTRITGRLAGTPDALLDDPINKTTERIHWSVTLSPDEHYLIDLSIGYCELKKTSGPGQRIGNVKEIPAIGRCSDGFSKQNTDKVKITFAPDGQSFAVATEHRVRIHRIAPFQLEMEAEIRTFAERVSVSDNGLLALLDRYGELRVWDIESGKAIGQHIPSGYDAKERYSGNAILAFQPKGNKLALYSGGVIFFDLPERPVPQKSP